MEETEIHKAGYEILQDIDYVGNSHPKQQLDVYRPVGARHLPAVVYFHGGGWEYGDKATGLRRIQHFFDTGYVYISVGYRLSDEATWPAMMDDAVAALKYIKKHAVSLGVDSSKIALWGSSAGAHLAGLLAGGCRYGESPNVTCFVNFCAPVTVNEYVQRLDGEARLYSPVMKFLGGDHEATQEMAEEATVTNWVTEKYPPTWIAHSKGDKVVPIRQSHVFKQRIEEVGGKVELFELDCDEHRVDHLEVQRRMKQFLAKHFE